MVAVGGDDAVLLCDRCLHADGDSLLAVVEVAEFTDQLGLVKRVSGDLHPPHRRHVAEEGRELLRGGIDGARRRIALVACERDAGLDGDGGLSSVEKRRRREGVKGTAAERSFSRFEDR